MSGKGVRAMTSAAALTAVAAILGACGGSETAGTSRQAGSRAAATGPAARGAGERPAHGVVADCSTRSYARFPAAVSNSRNLVVGPLVLVGGAHTPASTVREYGGNKFPLLVRAGHRVTVELSRRTRRAAGLAYGPLPQGEVHLRDAHRVVTFIACRRRQPSRSSSGGQPATFWAGGVVTRSPRCVPLRVWVDNERSPRPATLPLGVGRCA